MKLELKFDIKISKSSHAMETLKKGTILSIDFVVPESNTILLIVNENRSFCMSIDMVKFCTKEIK